MEKFKHPQKSVLGSWWVPIRKWFYTSWLFYEISIRFYDYGLATYNYVIEQQAYFGETISELLAVSAGVATFLFCSFYLTVPACYTVFKFFKESSATSHPIIHKLKTYF